LIHRPSGTRTVFSSTAIFWARFLMNQDIPYSLISLGDLFDA
jgi:hypothetical protein